MAVGTSLISAGYGPRTFQAITNPSPGRYDQLPKISRMVYTICLPRHGIFNVRLVTTNKLMWMSYNVHSKLHPKALGSCRVDFIPVYIYYYRCRICMRSYKSY